MCVYVADAAKVVDDITDAARAVDNAADAGKIIIKNADDVIQGAEKILPNQGIIKGDVSGAPPIDAGKQGKHVPGHNNYTTGKSSWPQGQTGTKETQQAWQNGQQLPDGTKVWDTGRLIGANGETGVRVHIDDKGNIHGYPVNPSQYLSEK